jgi:hypothetical protein
MYKDHPNVPNAAFYAMITNIDDNMGRLTAALDELGIAKDTILVFMTDNGTAAGVRGGHGHNAGMRGRKGSEYDGGHRVPCLIRWPDGDIDAGREIDRITAHIDLLPTLADLCGLPKPDVELDGDSLVPLLRNTKEAGTWPDRILVTDSQRVETPVKWRKSAVMTDRWRLVNGRELYDMQSDPGQQRDIAKKRPGTVARLTHAYEGWWRSVGRRFDEYCRIVIGSEHENPTRLNCHDWHGPRIPWNQPHIRSGMIANGFWALDVARPGKYRFYLRRWPREQDTPIREGLYDVVQARLTIGDLEVTRPVGVRQAEVCIPVELEAGPAELRTWFLGGKRTVANGCGAYYVYAERL